MSEYATPKLSGPRFQKGIGYPYPRRPRGPGRRSKPGGCYRMSHLAYEARQGNLRSMKRKRTHKETQRLQIEVALGTHRGETYRAMAKRLGLRSHAHCWRVARKYRRGEIPMLPRDEQRLMVLCDSLESPTPDHVRPISNSPEPTHAPGCECAVCTCPKCGKQRDPRDAAGYILLSNRCGCTQHSEDCPCASCSIARAIARAGPTA